MPAIEPLSAGQLTASLLLLGSVLALWSRFHWWAAGTAAAVLAGHLAGVLHGPAVVWLAAMAWCAWQLRRSTGRNRAVWIAALAIVSLLLGLHVLPGFSNPLVVHDGVLAGGAVPYSQYVNFDKTLGGTLLLGCSGWTALRSPAGWAAAVRAAAPMALATVLAVMAVSLMLGFVAFEPRWTPLFWTWAALNLLTTCMSEEAFFRGLVQTELRRMLPGPGTRTVAIGVSALLFGVAHAAGGWRYVVVAALAGVGYGAVYDRTSRLEMSILTHFTLNAVHFLLFTYPALR